MKTIMTTLALILALGLGAAMADELPAAAQRIWAPAGDDLGTDNHLTLTGVRNDDHGDEAKAAEDEGVKGDWMGRGLFNWLHQKDNGYRMGARGLLGNVEGGGLAGDGMLFSSVPGKYTVTVDYHAHDLFYDRDSELRNPTFPTVLPTQLPYAPHIDWRRAKVLVRYHASAGLDLYLGVDDLRREGSKSSLTRKSPPNVQTVDNTSSSVWLGGVVKAGHLGADLKLSYQTAEDTRAYASGHTYADERDRYSASLDAAYDVNPRVRVVAAGRMSRIEHTGTEAGVTGAGPTDGDTDSAAYQLGAITRLGQATTLRVSARIDSHDTEANTGEPTDILYAADRERDRQQYEVVVGNRSLARTNLQLRYRFSMGDESQAMAEGMRPTAPGADVMILDQETTRQDLSLRARTRLSRNVKLRADVRYTSLDVDQDRTWDAGQEEWFGVLGDHERSRVSWRLSMQTRPHRSLPVDLGVRGFSQTFERTEGDEVETTASQTAVFASTNWLASSRLTVFTMVSYGMETYELDNATATAGFEAFNVDATTLRLSPGATFTVNDKLQLDGWYEGVFFEDTGDESSTLNAIEADRDRLSLRARYQATERMAVSAGYARHEFDENRWDDYIQHLWTMSAQMRF